MKLNNVDMGKAGVFVEEVMKDKSNALKAKKVEGTWTLEEGKPQFSATLEHANGRTTIEADGPPFLGGSGMKPDPVQYCLFGLAACYAQTFASIAAEKGIELKKLDVAAENQVNLTRALGLSNDPIVEKAKITVEVMSDADASILHEIEGLARERCPGVYCLTNPIRLDIEMKRSG
ncbi:OsmC family protein [Candidatus Woesearchaeota archaeon]|nr:OsmC family protein [Candidatus Woesearchaeota archaeon]